MGRRIITNNVDKWEVFSSNTDSVIAEFKTEAGLKHFLAMETIYDAKLKAIEGLMCYPRGWTVNNKPMISANREQADVYMDWFSDISEKNDTYEAFYKAIDEKLTELLALNPEEVE